MRSGLCLAVLSLALAVGCDDGRSAPEDASADGAQDARADAPPSDGGRDGGEADAARDAGPQTCAELLETGRTFAPMPELDDTQVHPDTVLAGETLWLVFNGPEEGDTGKLDPWAVRLRCDGEQVSAPFRVNTTPEPNDADPGIALSNGRVLVAWVSDRGFVDGGTGTDNLDIRYRIFDVDGTPVMAEDALLETTRGGEPVPDNAWFPEAKGLPDGGFVIAGTRVLQAADAFQVFAQRLDADGALDGEAVDGYFEPDVTQTAPSVGVTSSGALHMAWASQPSADEEHAVHRPLDDPDAVPERIAPTVLTSGGPSMAVDPTDDARRYVAAHAGGTSQADIVITDVGRPAAERTAAELGQVGRLDHTPRLRAHPEGGRGAVAWFRVESGSANQLFVASFTDDAGSLSASSPREIPLSNPAGPYQPALTHVQGETWLLAWAERTPDGFRVRARFVSLA